MIEQHRGVSDKPIRQPSADFDFITKVNNGDSKQSGDAFKDGNFQSLPRVWSALNEEHWTHGLTISANHDWKVSEQRARDRLTYLTLRLKREIWGNDHQKQRKIELMVFKHSLIKRRSKEQRKRSSPSAEPARSMELVGEHWHALMAIKGNHGWSAQQIADAINEIERNSKMRMRSEKAIHVDFNWKNGNAFHSYVAREVKFDAKRWELEKKAKREAKSLSEWRDIKRHFEQKKIDKNIGDGYFVMSL